MRAQSGSAMFGRRIRARVLASTRSLRLDSQFDRYLAATCSLMLAVVLVAGVAGYAGIRGLLSSATTTAKAARPVPITRVSTQSIPHENSYAE
jgi:hypothetical protein